MPEPEETADGARQKFDSINGWIDLKNYNEAAGAEQPRSEIQIHDAFCEGVDSHLLSNEGVDER